LKIIGISSFYHDSAAALIIDGVIIAAVQEERFTRIKHDPNFPFYSIKWCLKNNNLKIKDIDFFVFYDKPFLKFERLLETYLSFSPYGFKSFSQAIPIWIKEKLFLKKFLINAFKKIDEKEDITSRLKFSEHHISHAASAFFPSPFNSSAILTLDGVGEWTTTSISMGNENNIEILKEIHFPHSLGLLYSAFTQYIGFKVNSGEYKLMGLAPYGKAIYTDKIIDNLVDIKKDGSFRLNQKYFDYCTGLSMVNKSFINLFGFPIRESNQKILQHHMDLAASIQSVIETIIIKICTSIKLETKAKNICLAGGVALNCVANGKLHRQNIFEDIWVQPASGDCGGAIGSALALYYMYLGQKRNISKKDSMFGSLLGPEWSNKVIETELKKLNASFKEVNDKELIDTTADLISKGKIIGWFQGKMEFGPRSLGNRSILADPRNKSMQSDLNLKIKYRESFRPFAPAILLEDAELWFELDIASPYMLFVSQVKNKHPSVKEIYDIPAVTHVDNSARVQTVDKTVNPKFHSLISKFKKITKYPILINTSFNVRGEPIVNSPEDAFRCFMGTGIDYLIIGNYVLDKKMQVLYDNENYKTKFKKD
tara:strand:+ start:1125 stop:2912 length:1788 start_codon:yes stop_codon:yes gene_type:complete